MAVIESENVLNLVKEKVKNRQNYSWLKAAREYNTKLLALVEGVNFTDLLSKIEHIEKSNDKFKARKKYSKSIKDLNERLLRPIENVFTSTGGSVELKMSDSRNATVAKMLNYCRGGKSLKKYMSTVWLQTYIIDPQGLTLIEVSRDGSKAYPTYKSVQNIVYYEPKGQLVEYVILELPKYYDDRGVEMQCFRFIDDEKDLIFVGPNVEELQESPQSIGRHIFKEVPAVINSDVEMIGSHRRLSIIDKVIEIQEEYLRDKSILTLVKFLNGFKNLIRPKVVCTSCHGLGKDGDETCRSCDGSGFLVNRDVTDEIVLPIDLNNENQTIPNASTVANWFGLDVETWNQYRGELNVLEMLIYEALWGTHMTNQTNKTATAKFIDTQPVINRLNKIADNAEFVEQKIANYIAVFAFPVLENVNGNVVINYGRRFIIDPPESILEAYMKAKENKASITILDRMYNEYLTGKYKGDEEQLFIALRKSQLEPYLHYAPSEVAQISQAAYNKKVMFGEWWKTLTMDQVRTLSVEELENQFSTFINQQENESL
jgi:hypothetical protein